MDCYEFLDQEISSIDNPDPLDIGIFGQYNPPTNNTSSSRQNTISPFSVASTPITPHSSRSTPPSVAESRCMSPYQLGPDASMEMWMSTDLGEKLAATHRPSIDDSQKSTYGQFLGPSMQSISTNSESSSLAFMGMASTPQTLTGQMSREREIEVDTVAPHSVFHPANFSETFSSAMQSAQATATVDIHERDMVPYLQQKSEIVAIDPQHLGKAEASSQQTRTNKRGAKEEIIPPKKQSPTPKKAKSSPSEISPPKATTPLPSADEPPQSDEKRRLSLERNRLAANKCRLKKKADYETLKESHARMEKQVVDLRAETSSLKEEVIFLKSLLLAHHDCDFPPIKQYLARESQRVASNPHHSISNWLAKHSNS
ncbi:hypothetical protein DFH27DRAFT_8399 [Peziza echinospora]|nr:hypothetical protein DFH27DRAFT_8399 [Peziza echinospora]